MSNILNIQLKSTLLLCATLGLFLLPLSTSAFFTDTETALLQQFQAAELQLDTTLLQSAIALGVNQPAASTTLLVDTTAMSVPAAFEVAIVGVSGELAFCDNIQIQASSGPVHVQSALPAFTTLEQSAFGAYELTFLLIDPSAVTVGVTCTATVAITAWQQNMSKTTGYHDTIEYQVQITAADLAAQRLAAPVPAAAEGEVAGARVSSPDVPKDPEDAPTKKEAEPADDTTVPVDPVVSDKQDPTDAAAGSSVSAPVAPAGNGETASDSDPVQPADEPEAKPKTDPTEPAESQETVDEAKPEPSMQPVEPPEKERESESQSTIESSPKEEVGAASREETPKEDAQSSTVQPAAKQPESEINTQTESEPATELEPAKPEVDESEPEPE